MNIRNLSALIAVCALSATVTVRLNAIVLVQTSDPGYYNNSIGTVLNNTNGGDTSTGYFPTTNDSSVNFATAPDLTAAAGALGNWLTNPLGLNSNWSLMPSIPNSWTPGTEVAIIYQFNTLGATNVVASFGVDNGIFAWLDGVYLGGARAGGHPIAGEYVFNVGNLNAGTHHLQLLLEDHGGSNGYIVNITADTFTPGPAPSVPESASYLVIVLGLGFVASVRRILSRY